MLATALVCITTGCQTAKRAPEKAATSGPAVAVAPTLGPPASDAAAAKSSAEGKAPPLTREEAFRRARQLGRVTYSLWFGVDEKRDFFEGRATIRFDLKPRAREAGDLLFVDFAGGTIRTITLNGAPIDSQPDAIKAHYDGYRLKFKLSELLPASNRLEISYVHPFSTNSVGLYRFQDPADSKVYLYTDLEPYNARLVFPCFDQPDLKASFELTVEAPEDWEVISNTPERDTSATAGRQTWVYPPSPLFSTYVFALHAGPFKSWKGDAHGIPLRLFARGSMARYVDARRWLDVTRKGLEFFEYKFGYPYPYAKYDQVIVPDLGSGAMENVGAVTFSEAYLSRSRETQDVRRLREDTILHEMAHMWFGNLVTMRWWSALWLNESFASLMANWAQGAQPSANASGGLGDRSAEQMFYAQMKLPALAADQLVTTHPIDLPVPDTDVARSDFDDITYGKGASVLKQLVHFLGEDDFLEGIQRYFQRFALRSTTLYDFFKSLAEASSQPLARWQKQWLLNAGVNSVRADWACEGGKVSRFSLVQAAPELPAGSMPGLRNELREHKTRIAFYRLSGGALRRLALHAESATPPTRSRRPRRGRVAPTASTADFLDFSYAQADNPVPAAVGQPCPDLVFPNQGDFDYVKVELDPRSLQTARGGLGKLEDPLTRQMIWSSLWQMVLDGKLRAQDYADLALAQGARETDTQVLVRLLRTLVPVPGAGSEGAVLKFLTGPLRDEYWKKLEAFQLRNLEKAGAGSDIQMIWYHAYLQLARSPKAIAWARAMLAGKAKLPGFRLDEERRWKLVQMLARNGVPDSAELIAKEAKRDPTDHGEKAAIAAGTLVPDAASKAQWLQRILRPSQGEAAPAMPAPGLDAALPLAKLERAMASYGVLGQEEFVRASEDAYFQAIPRLQKVEDEEYATALAEGMYPSLCEPEVVARTTAVLDANPSLPSGISRSLRMLRQEEQRCIQARQLSR